MTDIRATASRQVYANKWMTLREDDIRRPDGTPGIYAVVDKPDYALVIACDSGAMIRAGDITDAQTVGAWALLLLHERLENQA